MFWAPADYLCLLSSLISSFRELLIWYRWLEVCPLSIFVSFFKSLWLVVLRKHRKHCFEACFLRQTEPSDVFSLAILLARRIWPYLYVRNLELALYYYFIYSLYFFSRSCSIKFDRSKYFLSRCIECRNQNDDFFNQWLFEKNFQQMSW